MVPVNLWWPYKNFRTVLAAELGLLLILACTGCPRVVESPTPKAAQPFGPLVFRVQTLPFRYERGETGAAWPVETTGGGVGIMDYDGDGRLDLFFAQGGPLR